ncbi:hypothetical protein [Desulfoferula mesophila]|uniref:Uncharacterized protein n=1 Tax=Desulfoferula mesophila TaxID=3058419 RepID=A0AAU9EVA3_9BACT|nr:hypothetical protein FAK_40700 [Desulfoferula mesophilus]
MDNRLGSIAIAIVLSISFFTTAQARQVGPQEEKPKTKLELFERQTGTVVLKGYSEIGTISALGSVSVDCIELKNMTTGKRQFGIVIEVKESGRLERSNRSFIDYDEISPLIKGISYISKVDKNVTKLKKFEATVNGGVSAGQLAV